MRNFITDHMVDRIKNKLIDIQKEYDTKCDGFYFFDIPIKNGDHTINRINRWAPFREHETFPCNWYIIKGDNLLKIYNQLDKFEFYMKKNVSCDYTPYKREVMYRLDK